jgi:VCBS repeat-containing protein
VGVLDGQRVSIDWGDSTYSGFQLPDPGSLFVGETFDAVKDNINPGYGTLTITSVDAATGSVGFEVTGHTYTTIISGLLTLDVVDDENAAAEAFTLVPFGLDLTSFTLPASTTENGDATLGATFTAVGQPGLDGTPQFFDHEIDIDWGDPNNPQSSTFVIPLLKKLGQLSVGTTIDSTTDNSVLRITGISAVNYSSFFDYDLSISFEVVHRYLDHGPAPGNGTASDPSDVYLTIFQDSYFDHRGVAATQTVDILNQAPTVTLVPFDDTIGNGGVAILGGTVADPGTLDAIALDLDWGDGTTQSYSLSPSATGTQNVTYGHVYATEGDFTITATVTDDDGGTSSNSTPVTVDFEYPPVAVDDEVSTTESAAVEINVLADYGNGADSDPDGDLDPALTVHLTSPLSGIFTPLGNGVFSFDPDGQYEFLRAGQSQVVSFDYQIEDSLGRTDAATVTITINGENDTPGVSDVATSTDEDSGLFSLDLLAAGSATDVDATDVLSVTALSKASGRPLVFCQNGNLLEFDTNQFNDLAVGQTETLIFDFTVSDNSGAANDSVDGQVTIVVHGRNDAPSVTAADATVTIAEGQIASNAGTFSDADLADIIAVSASVGTISHTGGSSGIWTWSLGTTDGPDESQKVTITAIDGRGESATTSFDLTVNNVAPTIVLSGASSVDEGSPYTLTLGAVTDPGSDTLSKFIVKWGDASSDEYAASGDVTHTFADDAYYTITVDLVDEDGTHVVAGSHAVTVNNVAPTIDSLTSSATFASKALPGETVTITGFFSDAGSGDTHSVSIEWDDGSVTNTEGDDLQIDQVSNTFTASHVYTTGGVFTIAATVTDNDGAYNAKETTVVVTGVRLTDDGELQIVGTDGADDIGVKYQQRMGVVTEVNVETQFAGHAKVEHAFDPATVSGIVVYACDGDDVVTIQDQVGIDAVIHGDGGNDRLTGGGGNDVILGGDGNDILIGGGGSDAVDGGSGRNILIGGIGADNLTGGNLGDLMIGGSTAFDKDATALNLLLAEWTSGRSYEERVDNIRSGKGDVLKGTKVALVASGSKQTVFDDGDIDIITGNDGRDSFFASLSDNLVDQQLDEFWEFL